MRRTASWIAALTLCACADLPGLVPGVCGNGVIEPELDEQCDMSEAEELGPDIRCGDPSDVLRACHYVCSRSASGPRCPQGWGCSDDGVCRYASGEFVELEESPIELSGFDILSVADVDGDQRNDIVTASKERISVYFGRRNQPYSAQFHYPLQSLGADFAIGDVDNDEKNDVVAVSPVGPIMLRGQRSRTLEPVIVSRVNLRNLLSPHVEWMRMVPFHEDQFTPCFNPDNVRNLVAIGTANLITLMSDDERLLYSQPINSENLPSRFISTDLTSTFSRGYGSDELIIALPGIGTAQVFMQTCIDDPVRGWVHELEREQIELPGDVARLPHVFLPDVVQDTALPADMDADGDFDLLFPVIPASIPLGMNEQKIAVAINHGTSFGPAVIAPELDVLDDYTDFMGQGEKKQTWPLAAGDLDSDGDADFVATTGMFRYVRDAEDNIPGNAYAQPESYFVFAEAAVADVDADGINDVVGVQAGDGALVVFSSQAGGGYAFGAVPYFIPTKGAASMLRVADYDGDYILDVAFVEQGEHFGTSLSLLYGRELIVAELGSTGNVRDIEPATVGGEDGRADLFVTSKDDGDATPWQVGLLFGTQERTMLAPLPLGDSSILRNRAVLGNFVYNSSDDLDLAVLSLGRVDIAVGDGSARFGEYGQVRRTPWSNVAGVPGAYLNVECLTLLAANVDTNSPTDEIISVLDGACRDRYEGMSAPGMGEDQSFKSSLAIGFDTAEGFRARTLELAPAIRDISQVHAIDLDSSGQPEVLILYGKNGAGGILIFWNIALDLSAEQPIRYDGVAPTVVLLDGGTKTPFALAVINADDQQDNELAILGSGHGGGTAYVWIGSIRGATSVELGTPVLELEISPRESLRLIAEDIDRDGLSDLIFGDGGRVHLFRSLPEGEVLQ